MRGIALALLLLSAAGACSDSDSTPGTERAQTSPSASPSPSPAPSYPGNEEAEGVCDGTLSVSDRIDGLYQRAKELPLSSQSQRRLIIRMSDAAPALSLTDSMLRTPLKEDGPWLGGDECFQSIGRAYAQIDELVDALGIDDPYMQRQAAKAYEVVVAYYPQSQFADEARGFLEGNDFPVPSPSTE